MKKLILINCVVVVMALAAGILWCNHYAELAASRAVAENQEREFQFWERRLVPMYQEMGVRHHENPPTKEELFGPLLKMLEPMQERPD